MAIADRKISRNAVPPAKPSCASLGTVFLQKALRIRENNVIGLAKNIYSKDVVMLLQMENFAGETDRNQNIEY